jgi:hypothetical protein
MTLSETAFLNFQVKIVCVNSRFAALQPEQKTLSFQTGRIAAQLAAFRDDAMAGDQDANWVCAVGLSDGALGGRFADAFGEFLVGDGLAVRDFLQFGPNTFLEIGAVRRQRDGKAAAMAGEVFVQLAAELIEDEIRLGSRVLDVELQCGYAAIVCFGEERAHRCFDNGSESHI